MEELRIIRKRKGLTQLELSQMSGMTINQISNIEKGKAFPSPGTRSKLETALKARIDWVSKIKIRKSSYRQAENLLKRLMEVSALLDQKERKALTTLISKYFKN